MLMTWEIETGSLDTAGGVVRTGDIVCRGVWLNNVAQAKYWF
jgi:hypothetical protein